MEPEEELAAVREIKDEDRRANTFASLAPHLTDELKTQAFVITCEINNQSFRVRALTALVPHLTDELKTSALQEALAAVRKIEDEYARSIALVGLAPHLNEDFKILALFAAREIKNDHVRVHTLVNLARYLSNESKALTLQETLVATRELKNEHFRADILTILVPQLNDDLKIQALDTAREIKDKSICAYTLKNLAPNFNNKLKAQVLQETFFAASEIKDEIERSNFLAKFVQNLDNNELKILVLQESLITARKIRDENTRAHILFNLLPYLEQDVKVQVFQEVVVTADEIKDEFDRVLMWINLAEYLRHAGELLFQKEVLQKALAVARNIYNERNRASALFSLARHLDSKLRDLVFEEAVSAEAVATAKAKSSKFFSFSGQGGGRPIIKPTSTSNINHALPNEVSFTSYHPKEGRIEFWHTLLVYTHILSALDKVQEDSKRFDDQIKSPKETTSKSLTAIAHGTELTIIPSCAGVTFNPKRVSFKWLEDFHRSDFRFKANESLSGDAAKGQITIYVGPLIIGTLKFAMLFNEEEIQPVPNHEENAKMYDRDDVFISYSRKDSEVASTFKTVLESTGLDVFLDVDNLRSGQLWQNELKRRIERAKIFQIFWSANYSQSENCKQEWEYALKQNKDEGYIRPVFWQKPLSPNPPEELNKFNFKYVELK